MTRAISRGVCIIWSWRSGALHSGVLRGGRYHEVTSTHRRLDSDFLYFLRQTCQGQDRWSLHVLMSRLDGLVATRIIVTTLNMFCWLNQYPLRPIAKSAEFFDSPVHRADYAQREVRTRLGKFSHQLPITYARPPHITMPAARIAP